MDITSLFGQLSLSSGDYIKSQSSFTDYYEGYGFFGVLSSVTTAEMYAVKLSSAATMRVHGTPTTLPKSITLNTGWTWLPCPYQAAVDLSVGAPVFSYSGGDQFKSQSTFSDYYDGFGWFGTLNTLQPGHGYKVKVATGGSAVFSG